MNTSCPRPLVFLLASALAALPVTAPAAAPKVEETVIGPTNVGGAYTVAFAGAHVAYSGKKGTRFYVSVNGVSGPEFDALYKTNGPEFYYPEKAGVWRSPEPGRDGNDAPVLFSRDGSHYAYSGRQGEEYVVMHDGKEVGRFPTNTRTQNGPKLSPLGKHVYWTEGKMEQGRSIGRTVIDGKATEWGMVVEPVFSPDDTQFAWAVSVKGPADQFAKSLIYLNGKPAGYEGQSPMFTADSKSLLVVSNDGGAAVLLDGKRVISGNPQVTKVVVGPVGKRYGAIVRQQEGSQFIDYLYIDGKQVPDSHYAQDVWFSPDGKRYAAMCKNPFGGTPAMLIDGDAYEFARIDAAPPLWTADSSKIIFTGGTNEGSFIAVNDDLYEYAHSLIQPVVAQTGNTFAWGTLGRGAEGHSMTVGTKGVLPQGVYVNNPFVLSPDGSRFAYFVSKYGRSDLAGLVIDDKFYNGFGPAYLNRWLTSSLAASIPFVFSPDSKHVAYAGRSGAASRNSLYINETVVQANVDTVAFVTFTPDSQHLFWMNMDPRWMNDVYVDGQMAVHANGSFFREMPVSFEVDAKGVATFLAQDGDVVKRYRITPPSDTSVATLLQTGTTAVASAPPKAPAPAGNPPAPAAAVNTPRPPSTSAIPAPGTANTPPAAALTWNDLVRRPEALPATCTVNKDFRFQNGGNVRAGTKVSVLEATAQGLGVSTVDGRTSFLAKPEDTDVLAVANAAWALLTPAQRDLTTAALPQRMDLWPYRVKLLVPFTIEGQTIAIGDPAQFLGFENGQLLVRHERTGFLFNVDVAQTDLLAQARGLVASEAGAPGRLIEELAAARLVNPSNGQPAALDLNSRPKYVVMYRGAGWCGPCQAFSPELVKLLKEKAPSSADVALIYVSADNNSAEAKAYTSKIGIDWPTIYYKRTDQLPAFYSLFGDAIPQLVVTDRHGKVVVDSAKIGTARALQQLAGLL